MTQVRMTSASRAGVGLVERLLACRPEIEEAVRTRAYAIADPAQSIAPEYAAGLQRALSAALDYGFAVIAGGDRTPPPPEELLGQARLAALNGVSLDTVLRRYFAGYALFAQFLVREAEKAGGGEGADLKRILRVQAVAFDRLVAAVSGEYERAEAGRQRHSPGRRRLERVRRLLDGEPVDERDLGYRLEAWHLGLVVSGPGADSALRRTASTLDRSLLIVAAGEETYWAWLGGRRRTGAEEVRLSLRSVADSLSVVGLGEPARDTGGWRLTHRQARAAVALARHASDRILRYGDVALAASMRQDDLLVSSLREIYLKPLEGERDGGAALRDTLRAFFAAQRNVSAAAAALGVSRQTVASRLRLVEELLGRPLGTWTLDLEAALLLEDLEPALTLQKSSGAG